MNGKKTPARNLLLQQGSNLHFTEPAMAIDHYENFPVASILLPKRLRAPITHIYRFARSADDIADEGAALPSQRLALLAGYREALRQIQDGHPLPGPSDTRHAIFAPLERSIREFKLPLQHFFDLLSAFEQDVVMHRYPNEDALLDYCTRSANPVGRLVLHLYDAANDENTRDSDAICTGLQLTNFWQDVAIDWNNDRLYIPLDALARHGVTEEDIASGSGGAAWEDLMRGLVQQARTLLLSGLPLAYRLRGRAGFELRLTVQGGLRILERLEQLHYNIFAHRPTLGKPDWIVLLARALRKNPKISYNSRGINKA